MGGKKKSMKRFRRRVRNQSMRGDPNFPRAPGKWNNKKFKLTTPDWSAMDLEEIKKDFYEEHSLVTARSEAEVKEYRDKNKISVQGRDCPKPIQAFTECDFPEAVMSALLAQSICTPTPIQSQSLPIALSGRDLVGIAETGSGKTLAYILPAITHIHGKEQTGDFGEPDVVVLAPTRELAQQINQVVLSLGPAIEVSSECFYGGAKRSEQKLCAEKAIEICIGTPGRLNDFLCENLIKLHRCTYFVLDEADRMLDMGFEPQIRSIIGQARPGRQMLMFSATWPQSIRNLAESYLKDYIMVNIGALEISANHSITQKIEICQECEKPERLAKIVGDIMELQDDKTLIFVNSKFEVDVLTFQFRVNGWQALGIHGGKKQTERDRVFDDFKNGKTRILIATDVAARGLDVDDIHYIVNYDYPHCSEDYVHRIGRTGRCNRTGTAITLFTENNRNEAKALISVLEEAGQPVSSELQHIADLPPLHSKCRQSKPPGSRLKKKILNSLVSRSDINQVRVGFTTNAKRLPSLADIDKIVTVDSEYAGSGKPRKKIEYKVKENSGETKSYASYTPNQEYTNVYKWTKSDADIQNPEKVCNTAYKWTKSDANIQSNSSVPPVTQKDQEKPNAAAVADSEERPCKKMKTSIEDTGNNSKSAMQSRSVQLNRQNASTDRNSSFQEQQRMGQNLGIASGNRNEGMSNDPRSMGMPMDPGNMGMNMNRGNMRMPMNHGNMRMPMNHGNMRMPMNPGNMRMPMNPGNMRMPMNHGNMGMNMNQGNMGMNMNSGNMGMNGPRNMRMNNPGNMGMNNPENMGMNRNYGNMGMNMNPGNMGMNRCPGNMGMNRNPGNMGMNINPGNMGMNRNPAMSMDPRNVRPAYGNPMGNQNSGGWGGNYRPGMNQYPSQSNWTSSGYNQSSGRYGNYGS